MNVIRLLAVIIFLPLSLASQTEFSQDSAFAILKHLAVDIGPRPMGSPAEHAGLQFAVSKFKEYGCDTAYLQTMDFTPVVNTLSGTAVGIKRGTTGRIILIGGHMDSAGPEIPGADDDGSGSATVIECCRVLAHHPTSSTLVFCCFGGEEQGLQGSQYFVNHFFQIDSVALMLQVDMANGLGIIDLDPDKGGGLSAPRWLVKASIEEFSKLGYRHLRYPTHFFSINYGGSSGAGSDHESFLDKGIPAIDFSTDVNKPIHTPRDNIENFDPGGLKRSGDLVTKLIERFDNGVPKRTLERYWLYLIGDIAVFLPLWSLWALFAAGILFSMVTLYVLWKQQRLLDNDSPRRWSGIKVCLCTLLIVLCGWFSSDIISLLRGVRYPWITSLPLYYVFAGIAMLLGCSLAYRLARRLDISKKPTGLYLRAFLLLTLMALSLSFWSTKLLIEPTVALIILDVAILVPNRFIKMIILILSPVWPLRLIFSEWDGLLFRPLARSIPHTFARVFLADGGAILFFSLVLLPFAFGAMAIARQRSMNERIFHSLVSPKFVTVFIMLFLGLMSYLLIRPTFDRYWYKSVQVSENYNLSNHEKNIFIQSAEYLKGLTVTGSGYDTSISGHTTTVRMNGGKEFDTSWAHLERTESIQTSGGLFTESVLLRITTAYRPYSVSVIYSSTRKDFASFNTTWKFQTIEGNKKEIAWYSFPDTTLAIPVSFTLGDRDSVNEEVVITFSRLASPLEMKEEFAYVVPRTNYTSTYTYRKN
jgi:hypothetical protein